MPHTTLRPIPPAPKTPEEAAGIDLGNLHRLVLQDLDDAYQSTRKHLEIHPELFAPIQDALRTLQKKGLSFSVRDLGRTERLAAAGLRAEATMVYVDFTSAPADAMQAFHALGWTCIANESTVSAWKDGSPCVTGSFIQSEA